MNILIVHHSSSKTASAQQGQQASPPLLGQLEVALEVRFKVTQLEGSLFGRAVDGQKEAQGGEGSGKLLSTRGELRDTESRWPELQATCCTTFLQFCRAMVKSCRRSLAGMVERVEP